MQWDEELYERARETALRLLPDIPSMAEATQLGHALSVLETMEEPVVDGETGTVADAVRPLYEPEAMAALQDGFAELDGVHRETQEETYEHVESGIIGDIARLEGRIGTEQTVRRSAYGALRKRVEKLEARFPPPMLSERLEAVEQRTRELESVYSDEVLERISRDSLWKQLQGYQSMVDKLGDRVEKLKGRTEDLNSRIAAMEKLLDANRRDVYHRIAGVKRQCEYLGVALNDHRGWVVEQFNTVADAVERVKDRVAKLESMDTLATHQAIEDVADLLEKTRDVIAESVIAKLQSEDLVDEEAFRAVQANVFRRLAELEQWRQEWEGDDDPPGSGEPPMPPPGRKVG